MRIWSRILIFSLICLAVACGAEPAATPLETFKTYVKATKAKDITTMKLLLSNATMKMHEQEAKAQGVSVDDIVKRETLLAEGQTQIEYKDEKINGDKATLLVKSSNGAWETVPFVREDGVWKIDKQGYADQMIQEMDESSRKLDEIISGAAATPSVEPGNTNTDTGLDKGNSTASPTPQL